LPGSTIHQLWEGVVGAKGILALGTVDLMAHSDGIEADGLGHFGPNRDETSQQIVEMFRKMAKEQK
jgi:hypothetical protein